MSYTFTPVRLEASSPVLGAVTVPDARKDSELFDFAAGTADIGIARMPGGMEGPVDEAHMADFANPHAVKETATRLRGGCPDAVVYDCLSASVVGDDAVLRKAAADGAGVDLRFAVTPISAIVAALRAVGAERLWLVSPYDLTLTQSVGDTLRCNGFQPEGRFAGRRERIFDVGPEAILELAQGARESGADAVVLLCTNLPTVGVIQWLEQVLGIRVISAHSALVWAGASAARLAFGMTGIPVFGPSMGRLGRVPWPGNPTRILRP